MISKVVSICNVLILYEWFISAKVIKINELSFIFALFSFFTIFVYSKERLEIKTLII